MKRTDPGRVPKLIPFICPLVFYLTSHKFEEQFGI